MKKSLLALSLAALLAGSTFAKAPHIDAARVDSLLKQHQMQLKDSGQNLSEAEQIQLRNDVYKNLQRNELLKAEAIKKGLDKETETKALHANLEADFYAGVLIANYQNTLKISPKMMQETYNLLRTEYQLEQAQFADIDSANKALETLKKGKVFAEVAKQYPAKTEDAPKWLSLQIMPPELTDKVLSMTKGEISNQPVLVGGLYTLFKVSGTRINKDFPSYDKVEPQLENLTKQLKTKNYVNNLFKSAGL